MHSANPDTAAKASASSLQSARTIHLLLMLLSVTAGSTDIIGFLRLDGLFTAHITGNLVLLAARIVSGGQAKIAAMLSVPVFMVIVCAATLLAGRAESLGRASLRPLLLLQFLFLAGFVAFGVATGLRVGQGTVCGIVAGMMGVSAMAVQNALVQISFKGAPSTAVMTTNVTRFAVDLAQVVLKGNAANVAAARDRAARTLPLIIGFAVGGALGAACEAALGLWSLALPASLALLALGGAFPAEPDRCGT